MAGWRLCVPGNLLGQGSPSKSLRLFQQHCVKCHAADGTGKSARQNVHPPDFTNTDWQARQTDARLLASILEGKGADMPSFSSKLSKEQARSLVAHVRAFARGETAPRQDKHQGDRPARFQQRYRRLTRQMGELQRQFHRAAKDTPENEASSRQQETASRSPTKPTNSPAAGKLFQKHCVKCHAADGTGKSARIKVHAPDFTDASWHTRRSDPQLLKSILDGKGDDMPSFSGKLSKEQARSLVAHVRAFAPKERKPRQQPDEISSESEEDQAEEDLPGGFFVKVISWLGSFHPPAVHFPIALLAAAALAELLRFGTGNPVFDSITRYCIWLGTLMAVLAGTLGWCAGGFHPGEDQQLLATHRWLGTATVTCAGLLLVLCEWANRRDNRWARVVFRITLLVVALLVSATGYLGGAMVFGPDHHAWPG
jgi:mono/diheme cytochrome c family protein/uncharacterized membrane protein